METTQDRPTSFTVYGLFDRFTHTIALPTAEKPIRFLSAPNGYGKSTALRILRDIAQRQWRSLGETFFQSASIAFESGEVLSVQRKESSRGKRELVLTAKDPSRPEMTLDFTVRPRRREAELPAQLPPWIRRVGSNRFIDTRYGESLTRDAVAERYNPHYEDDESRLTGAELPEALQAVLGNLVIDYLDANRLSSSVRQDDERRSFRYRRRSGSPLAIDHISDLVEDMLLKARSRWGAASEKAERTFPARVLEAFRRPTRKANVKASLLEERYERLRKTEKELQALSLTDSVMGAIAKEDLATEGAISVVLDLMFQGIEERFAVLEDTPDQLRLFRDTLNRMLDAKSIQFACGDVGRGMWRHGRSGNGGIEVIDNRGRSIPLTALSSGEQHLVVMFGHILFTSRMHRGGLVLLDEPEISLHPEWQMALSGAFKEVAAINDCRMLLATHSPIMIGNDWDNETSLAPKLESQD